MGYKLYREVRDYAPPDWTSGELVVALMIADDARDDTRTSWIPLEMLCARTRLKPSSVREKLAMLARRGYEFRVIHGFGKDGRPVFAARGHATDFLVPPMPKGAGTPAPKPVDNPAKGAGTPAAIDVKGAGNPVNGAGSPAPIGEKGAGLPAPLSSKDLNPHIPSTEEDPHDGAPVESNGSPLGQERSPSTNGHRATALERLALQAVAESRAARQATTKEAP